MKRFITTLTLAILFIGCFAQDLIVKKDGTVIQAKVVKVGNAEVDYKKWSNQNGPSYTIAKNDVLAITYQNGEKETFEETPVTETVEPKYVEKQPDARNSELVAFYNKDYTISPKLKQTKDKARTAMAIFKVAENSVMSNEDLEMYMEVEPINSRNLKKGHPLYMYRIVLKNKTKGNIYIDKANCLRATSMGDNKYYYPGSYGQQVERYVVIPPGVTTQLVKNVYEDYEYKECVEVYNFDWQQWIESFVPIGRRWDLNHVQRFLDFEYGLINVGETQTYTLETSPFAVEYSIVYSKTEDFKEYSALDACFYMSQLIGLEKNGKMCWNYAIATNTKKWMSGDKNNYTQSLINGYSSKTLVGAIGLVDDIENDVNVQNMLRDADMCLNSGQYKKAIKLYRKAYWKGVKPSGTFFYKMGLAAYKTGGSWYYIAKEYLRQCKYFSDLDANLAQTIPDMIGKAEYEEQARRERMAAIGDAIAGALTQTASTLSNMATSNTKNNNRIAPTSSVLSNRATGNLTGSLATNRATSRSTSHADDESDGNINDVKIKCLECGGSGKCKPSGVVEARTTRCGGSGKCPMCNGKGKSFTKCAKCKGKGCSKCDDSGYLDCSACDGSGECQHCDGKGKCPRCHGTGKE